ncbi:hypothetical protein HPS41_07335 [Glaesserella parasuis ST4-1]|nr:hypothetical protein HPS41_07335 [Glaesserella parasuis ST4-1]
MPLYIKPATAPVSSCSRQTAAPPNKNQKNRTPFPAPCHNFARLEQAGNNREWLAADCQTPLLQDKNGVDYG